MHSQVATRPRLHHEAGEEGFYRQRWPVTNLSACSLSQETLVFQTPEKGCSGKLPWLCSPDDGAWDGCGSYVHKWLQ